MAEQRDGVADGWILYEAWCKRNGGTPIRAGQGQGHSCWVGPIDETIDPGDEGTVDVAVPDSGMPPELLDEMVALEVQIVELRLAESKLNYNRAIDRINRFKRMPKE